LVFKVRALATAFLVSGDEVVLMKRAEDRRLFPGKWAALGGHVEPHEIGDPRTACLRELREEAGLTAEDICDLRLCYLVSRLAGQEIRLQYIYFGTIERRPLASCEEGELHWVDLRKAILLDTSFTTREILRRYISQRDRRADGLLEVGVVGAEGCEPRISWAPLQDWE